MEHLAGHTPSESAIMLECSMRDYLDAGKWSDYQRVRESYSKVREQARKEVLNGCQPEL